MSPEIAAVLSGESRWCVVQGDCMDVLPGLPDDAAILTDPPYGMAWDTDSTRFSGGVAPTYRGKMQARGVSQGRDDWGAVTGDRVPFDPTPLLRFPKVLTWGAHHYANRLPTGTTLVWIKKADHLFGTFLSDADTAWMLGGYGVYCYRQQFPPSSRMQENGGTVAHPTQKPIGLGRWCLTRMALPENAVVVDPYCGSGSFGIAAVQMGFRFIGIEREAAYMEIARQRIAAAAAQTNLFAGNDA